MNTIVPPTAQLRKVTRQPKALRSAKLSFAFTVLAGVSLTTYATTSVSTHSALIVGLLSSGAALIAAVCALVFRFLEVPKEVIIRTPSKLFAPPVIHLNRNA